MTAQVVVMNSIGAAVAADSAVSIGSGKTFTTADKLFQLSHEHAVGIMIYQSASIAGLPWETLIKEFRKHLGPKHCENIEAYNGAFLDFIDENTSMLTAEMRDQDQDARLRAIYEQSVYNAAWAMAYQSGAFSDERLASEAKNAVSLFCRHVDTETSDLEVLDEDAKHATRDRSRPTARELAHHFQSQTRVEDSVATALQEALTECLCKDVRSQNYTGVVIVGFGDDDFFPTCTKIDVDGFAAGHVRLIGAEIERLNEAGARVLPYAQTDVVELFMHGVARSAYDLFSHTTSRYVVGVAQRLCSELKARGVDIPDVVADEVRRSAVEGLDTIQRQWNDVMAHNYQSIIDSIRILPKEDLGNAAEALVDLTRFRRHASTTPETVGGPIDVAIITRGDGFVWTKRKHYFSPELNPRAIAKYNRPKLSE